MNNRKQNLGQFNTKNDVWLRSHIKEFIMDCGCDTIVDPFAGGGDLLYMFPEHRWVGYDIDPAMGWEINDGLLDVPYWDNAIVVTNPPYLAKNSANRNDLESYKYFEDNNYEDLYQLAIYRVLAKYEHSVFIIPETFFLSKFFRAYIYSYTVIEENPFTDTDCPVCVVCFHKDGDFMKLISNNYDVYKNDKYLFNRETLEDITSKFELHRLDDYTYHSMPIGNITFNDLNGNLGLRGVDGVEPLDDISFTYPTEEHLKYPLDSIKDSSRAITIINVKNVEITDKFIQIANIFLADFRIATHDVVLSPFKNNNKLGMRRRRLDYYWARKIIEKTIQALDK